MQLNSLIALPKRTAESLERLRVHVARMLAGDRYRITPEGVIFDGGVRALGQYFSRIREREPEFVFENNKVVDQGVLKILGIALGPDPKLAGFYLALTAGTAPVTNDLAASSFAATMNEITSTTEGYSSPTRPQWTPGAPAAGVISNIASKATYNIVTSTSISVTGAGLLSDSGRGSTSGFLISASLFSNARQLFNGETFDLGYQVSLTD